MPDLVISPGGNARLPGALEFGPELTAVRPFKLATDGMMSWGDGDQAHDVSLSRSAAGTLNIQGAVGLLVNGAPVGGSTVVATSGFVTTGDVSVTSAFTALTSDVSIAAVTGDRLKLTISALCNSTGDDCQFEAATRVAGADTNWWSSGNATSRWPGGIGSWYVSTGFTGPRAPELYTVQAGDLVAGVVTVRLYGRCPATARTVFRNANYPIRWTLENIGQ